MSFEQKAPLIRSIVSALGAAQFETCTEKDNKIKDKSAKADRIMIEDKANVPASLPASKRNILVNMQWLKECLHSGRSLPPLRMEA